jgi:hypothetical protein
MYSPTPDLPHVSSNYIYDTLLEKWRPILDSDFGGGAGGKDAFGRLRISNPEMIFNSKQIFDNQPLYWDDIQESGSGTSSVHSVNTASSTLSVSATTAGKRTRQTFMRFNYQPSKSQLIFITGILKASGGGTGIITRMGYFDDDNGLFLECNAGIINLVRRTKTSGSAQDDTIPQSSWNLDKMDGTGSSRISLDFTKTQIFMMDFEWLGVGRVRFGFNVEGTTYYVHELSAANSLTTVYMSTPNLLLRYQIINDGTGIVSSINCICSAVISEGGREDLGTNLYLSTGVTAITAAKDQSNALLGFKLKSAYKGCTIDILDLVIYCSSVDSYEWKLILNPTVAGTFTYNDVTNSPLQSAIGSGSTNSTTGGTVLAGGYGTSKSVSDTNALKNLIKLGSSIAGVMDTLVLCAYPLGSTSMTIYSSVNYRSFN